jgi:RNA polymerase sigma factor (sigma-70 family)
MTASSPSLRLEQVENIMEEQRRQSFEDLLQSHQAIVYKVTNTYCWQLDERADLAQEIVVQLWRAWPQYDTSRSFTTWMYRIALNVAISFVRQEVRRREVSVPLEESHHEVAEAPAVDPIHRDRLQRLQGFIERQPALDRALLLLYQEDRSQREISEILGITPTNISTKINRLKQRMRNEI